MAIWEVNHTTDDKAEATELCRRFQKLGLPHSFAGMFRLAVSMIAELPDEDIHTLAERVKLRRG